MSESLTEFLLARIAEDEAVAKAAHPSSGSDTWVLWVCDEHQHVAAGEDRVLAECEAKRRIVEECRYWIEQDQHYGVAACQNILPLLALPYADHPQFQEEWRP